MGRRIHVITHKLYAMLGIPTDQATTADPTDEDADSDVLAPGRTSR